MYHDDVATATDQFVERYFRKGFKRSAMGNRAKTSMDILDTDYDDFERKIVNGETFVLKQCKWNEAWQ